MALPTKEEIIALGDEPGDNLHIMPQEQYQQVINENAEVQEVYKGLGMRPDGRYEYGKSENEVK